MSGPKKSKAQLRAEERARIRERERLERERKKREEQARLKAEAEARIKKEALKKAWAGLNKVKHELELNSKLCRNALNSSLKKMKVNASKIEKISEQIKNSQEKSEKIINKINNKSDDVIYINNCTNELIAVNASLYGMDSVIEKESSKSNKEHIAALLTKLSAKGVKTEPQENASNEVAYISGLEAQLYWNEKIINRINSINNSALNDSTAKKIEQKIEELHKNKTKAEEYKRFYTDDLPKLEKEVKKLQDESDRLEKEYKDLYTDYILLCEECGIELQNFSIDPKGISDLKIQIQNMELYNLKQKEIARIKEIVNEVMEELGYPVISSAVISNEESKLCNKILLQYEDDKGVDVTITDDGQLVMEIGLMDNIDRSPSEKEKIKLCKDMEDFCDSYKLIEEKLIEKGITFSDKNFMPPTAAYAEIINVSKYGVEIEYSGQESSADDEQQITQERVQNLNAMAQTKEGE